MPAARAPITSYLLFSAASNCLKFVELKAQPRLQLYPQFESKYANSKYHEAWLCALKQAISGDNSAEADPEGHLLQEYTIFAQGATAAG